MKRILSIVLVLVMLAACVACNKSADDDAKQTTEATTAAQTAATTTGATTDGGEDTADSSKLLAGFAEVDITPTELGMMPGGFEPVQAYKVVQPLFSNVAAFTCGGESVILISMDHLSFHEEYGNGIRQRISEATGVPTSNILVAATHTHSGMSVEYQLWLCPPDLENTARAADLTVEAAIKAWNSREESSLGTNTTYNSKYNWCRDWYMADGSIAMNPGVGNANLVKPISTPDHSVNVMRVDDAKDNIKCFIVNYANHPDCVGYDIGYSSDYPGFIRERLKQEYGEDVIVLYFNGASGDVNCIDWKNGTHTEYYKGQLATKYIGYGIAESIIKLNRHITTDQDTPVVQAISEKHTTTRRKKTQEQYEWALEIMEGVKNGVSYGSGDLAFATEYATEDDSQLPDTVDLEIHTIQIGDWAIVGLPSEIYSEIGHAIKRASPYKNTMVFSLANGTHGYISPDYVINSTAYEARYSKYNSYTGLGTMDVLVNGSQSMLQRMFEKYQGE